MDKTAANRKSAQTWYNYKGEVVKEQKVGGTAESLVEYAYDANGNLIR